MSYINFNPTAQQGFQNALSMGMQMGAQARQAREQKEYRNALKDVMMPNGQEGGDATGPNPDSMAVLAERNPALYMQIQERQRAQEAQQREGSLVQAAMAGDSDALSQLATVNFDKWKALDTQQRQAIEQEAEVYGNAAMDVLNLPPAQRPQAILGYANRLQSEEIAQIAGLPPQELEAALRAQVAESGMIKELQAMERPSYMAIPQGGTLVDTRNPTAVQQFGGPVQIADEAGYNALPPGAEYIDPQGNRRVKGGTASNGGGGFPTGQ